MPDTLSFNFPRFMQDWFKNPAGLFAFMQSYGVRRVTAAAVAKWFQRQQIPAEWLPLILGLLELEQGRPVSMADYLGR